MSDKQLVSHKVELAAIFKDWPCLENVHNVSVDAQRNLEIAQLLFYNLVVDGKENDLKVK